MSYSGNLFPPGFLPASRDSPSGVFKMIGPIVNSAAIIIGGAAGALFGKRIPERLKERLPLVFGCVSMGLGITMIVKVQNIPAVVLSLLLGTVIGELMKWEEGIHFLAGRTKGLVEKIAHPPAEEISHEEFMESFVSLIILFCVSGTGIFGAMTEGMTGDASLLLVKSFLDLPTAMIFAVTLGFSLTFIAIPQFLIQGLLYFGAVYLLPLTNEGMLADFSAVGGLIMLATGFKICRIVSFPTAGMLPSLILIMPVSALWMGLGL